MEQNSSSSLTMDRYAEVCVLSLLTLGFRLRNPSMLFAFFDRLIYMAVRGEI